MRYALLIHVDTQNPPPGDEAEHEQWMALAAELTEAGANVAGAQLDLPSTATTVRSSGGEVLNTDGPFAEVREMLAGFFLIDVSDLDAALGWAGKIPQLDHYAVEVRPVGHTSGA